MAKARGSIWANKSKKAGYTKSVGSYGYHESVLLLLRTQGDRFFKLKSLSTGKTRTYESPHAAQADGWYIVEHGK